MYLGNNSIPNYTTIEFSYIYIEIQAVKMWELARNKRFLYFISTVLLRSSYGSIWCFFLHHHLKAPFLNKLTFSFY